MKTFDLNATMPIDLVKQLKTINFQTEKEELAEAYELYEIKVERLKSLTRNYSVKYGYYYQSRLKSALKNYKISYVDINDERFKAFNKFNNVYSDVNILRDFDNNFESSLKSLHKMMIEVSNRGRFRNSNLKINVKFLEGITITPIKPNKIPEYLHEIDEISNYEWDQLDRFINSWIIHCYFMGIQPFTNSNGRTARFLLNKNINIYRKESIFLDQYILEDLHGYYNAIFDYCGNLDTEASVNWFVKTLKLALETEGKLLDEALLRFYDLLEEFETMELTISRNAEMLAALFCIEGKYLQSDIQDYFSQDILDKRTINKLLKLLVDKQYLIKEGKMYITKGCYDDENIFGR